MARKRKSDSASAARAAQVARTEEPHQNPPVVFVARSEDEKITLESLPVPARDIVCAYLAAGGHFQALSNFKLANKACSKLVGAYFKEKKNVPSIDAIIIKARDDTPTSFDIEIRLHVDAFPFLPNSVILQERIASVVREDEVACVSFRVLNRGDSIVPYIARALGANVRSLCVERLRDTEELLFINRKLLGKSLIREVEINLVGNLLFNIAPDFCSELCLAMKSHSVKFLNLKSRNCYRTVFDPKPFIDELGQILQRCRIYRLEASRYLLDLDDSFWLKAKERLESKDILVDFAIQETLDNGDTRAIRSFSWNKLPRKNE